MAKTTRQKGRSEGPQPRPKKRSDTPPPVRSAGRGIGSRTWLYIVTGAVAAVVAIALILTSVLGSDEGPEVSAIDGAQAAELLDGIPQDGNVLGSPDAPVTMVEFADLQCPFCQRWSSDVLPTIVEEYVRPGDVRIEFQGLAFIGPDSTKALRFAQAAGEQDRLWYASELLFENQGRENSGWVTDDLLRAVGGSTQGLDVDRAFEDVDSTPVLDSIDEAASQAAAAGVDSTPSFLIGPTGGELELLEFDELAPPPFTERLDELLARS